jgi:hypothetical protein
MPVNCDPNEDCRTRDCRRVAGRRYCTPYYNNPACITRVEACRGRIAECIMTYVGLAGGAAGCYACIAGTSGAGIMACAPICGIAGAALERAILHCSPS